MNGDRRREQRFTKYEQVLNIIFGAAFGALGSISLKDSPLSLSWFVVASYIVLLAIPSVWIVAAFATVSKCIAEGKSVKKVMYFIIFLFLAFSCVFINVCSELATEWEIDSRGTELSAILAAWAITYLLTGIWVRIQEKLA